MALIQRLIDPSKYDIKCPYPMEAQGVCIHNTANDASADNEISYMHSNNAEVSFHIAVDDEKAIQGLPLTRNAWAAGDGGKGNGNRNFIHVEICYSKSGGTRFLNAEKRAAKEIAALLKVRGWGIDRVKKHQDFSGKYCPHRTLDLGYQRIINMIKSELAGYTASNSTTTSTTKPVLTGDLYRVVVGSYSVRANAEAMMKKLKEIKDIESFLLPVKGKDGKEYLRVIAGSYKDRSNAEKVVKELIDAEFNAFVAPYDSNGNPITSTTVQSKPTISATVTPSVTVGSKVNILTSATVYATGQTIPSEQKGSKIHTVQQVSGDRVLLKEIVSWVYKKDIKISTAGATPVITNCDPEISRSNKSGSCYITESSGIIFRNRPCTCHGIKQGTYNYGESLYYDMMITTKKYTWVSWISSSTGTRRYMPVKDHTTGEVWARY